VETVLHSISDAELAGRVLKDALIAVFALSALSVITKKVTGHRGWTFAPWLLWLVAGFVVPLVLFSVASGTVEWPSLGGLLSYGIANGTQASTFVMIVALAAVILKSSTKQVRPI
jgi:energy-coupling factor transporter transmembrane protein EcfT